MASGNTRIVAGAVWMFVISVLLFWLPVVGPLVAGIVGGKKAGGVGAALTAGVVPAIGRGILLFVCATLLAGLPLVGVLAGMGAFVLVAAQVGLLLVGAIVGGLMAD